MVMDIASHAWAVVRSLLHMNDSQRNQESHKYYGRFNQGVVTLNLVDVACSSGKDM